MSADAAVTADRSGVPDARDRLIVALDVAEADEARRIVETLDGLVSFFKIGWHLFMVPGSDQLVADLKGERKRVFWDYKISDITETTKGAITRAAERDIDFMTVRASADVMDAVRGLRRNTKILYVSPFTLTHMDEADLRELGVNESIPVLALKAAEHGVRTGCEGMIVSGHEVADIRDNVVSPEFILVTPGIRPSGMSADDHKRATTPREAVLQGSDYLVVGRPIIMNHDRKDAAERILDEMQAAFDDRG